MEIMPHAEFRQTDTYRDLCAQFSIDPAVPLDGQILTVDEARHFWERYQQLHIAQSRCAAEDVTAVVERLLLQAEGNPAAVMLEVIQRWGDLLVVQSEDGQSWMMTATPANPEVIACAMARHITAERSPH